MNRVASGFEQRTGEGDSGALAIGSRDMDYRWYPQMRVAERVEKAGNAPQRQIKALGVQARAAVLSLVQHATALHTRSSK